jgi:hypothetical protein
MQERKANWDSLERICDLLYVEPHKSHDLVKMWVPSEEHRYSIYNGKHMPSFVYLPQHEEILYRMVIKAAFTENLSDLDLKLSNL